VNTRNVNRPNVVLVITDQQRFDTIGAAGRTDVLTPHLDRMAAEGTLFSHAYCTTPMCSPSRSSILSGLFPHSHRVVANHQARPGPNRMHLPEDVRLIADYLVPEGYRTAYVGKWHLGTGSDRRGFRDYLIRLGDGEGDTSRPEDNDYVRYAEPLGYRIGGKRLGKDWDPELYDARTMCGPSKVPLAHYGATFTCNRAEEFIRQSADGGSPFLLTWSCIEPHAPFVCPEPFYSMYSPENVALPGTRGDEGGQRRLERPCWQLRSALEFSEDDLRTMWARYLGTVSYIDYLVGRLISALSDTGQLNRTLFVFTSDHGEMLGSHTLLLKGAAMYEELMRVPLIVRAPRELWPDGGGAAAGQAMAGVPAGPSRAASSGVCDSLISQVDLLPTILSVCGAPIPEQAQGVDFSPLLAGARREVRPAVPGEYHSSNWTDGMSPLRMWRTREWKYVESREEDHELYHLAEDPEETVNLAGRAEHRGVQESLAAELHAWCRATDDRWPEVLEPSEADLEEAEKQDLSARGS